ncbi:MAG TPA: OmpA family protein [Gemmatimonadales bacterium]|nr:OmpA family protein [Gemmatimonadales bacterium]
MRITPLAITAAFAAVAVACHHPAPVAQVTPQPDADSLARVERARQDSIARADADRRARADEARRRADSLADVRRKAEEARTELATMTHFDFDRATIRPGDAAILDRKAAILESNPSVRIQIAGNCDERGSDEYNLALGNRRAITARNYLISHGVAGSRIETVSYGKEKPIDPAHNEEAWAKDRNDQFQLLTQNVVLQLP